MNSETKPTEQASVSLEEMEPNDYERCASCGGPISKWPSGWVHEDSDQRGCEVAWPSAKPLTSAKLPKLEPAQEEEQWCECEHYTKRGDKCVECGLPYIDEEKEARCPQCSGERDSPGEDSIERMLVCGDGFHSAKPSPAPQEPAKFPDLRTEAEYYAADECTTRKPAAAQQQERGELPPDSDECSICHAWMSIELGLERTKYCHLCAQDRVVALEAELAKVREEQERLQVQLAGCGVAATGWATEDNRAQHGDYGWSPAFEDIMKLREHSWRCFHCGFFTLDEKTAAAHFGDRDDAEEFKPLCKWMDRTPVAEQAFLLQDALRDLNDEREENMRLIDRAEKAEAELAALRAWPEAIAEMRDAILNERYGLAEAGAGPDVINAVLGIIDDLTPASTPNQDGSKEDM